MRAATLWLSLWVVATALALMAAVRLGRRLRGRDGGRPVVDDDAVRRILASGVLEVDDDEPLDLDAVADEERRFWEEEDWDEAEEW